MKVIRKGLIATFFLGLLDVGGNRVQNHTLQDLRMALPTDGKPRGYKPFVFPRRYLTSNEDILWEGRPALLPYILEVIEYIVISLIVSVVLSIAIALDEQQAFNLGLLMILTWIIAAILAPLSWRNTRLAISNRRILTVYGVFSRKYTDCAHEKVENTTVIQSFGERIMRWGNIMFATGAISGGTNYRQAKKMMTMGGGILWKNVKAPVDLHRYVHEIIEASRKDAKIKDYQTMASVLQKEDSGRLVTSRASTKPATRVGDQEYCTRCGAPVKPEWRFCKSCGGQMEE